jgi:uncharacterized protein (TIGR00297 family)
MTSVVLIALLAAGITAIFAAAAPIQRRARLAHETSRKLVHVTCGVVSAAIPHIVPDRPILIAASVVLFVALPLGGALGWFPGVVRPDRPARGPVCFLAAFLLLLVIEQDSGRISAAFLLVGLADAAACLVGQRWGRRRFRGSARTWLGSSAFFAVALAVLLVAGPLVGLSFWVALALALSGALITTALEAVTPSAADNFVVPVAAAVVLALGGAWSDTRAQIHLVEIALSVAIVAGAMRLSWLNDRGGLATLAVGLLGFVTVGWRPVAVLLAFFVASSALTRLRPDRAVQRDHVGGRDSTQVLALACVPILALVIGRLLGQDWMIGCLAASVAAAAADTWATEIGRFSRAAPRLITTLRPVPAGTSGGVSLLGLAGAALGSFAIAVVAAELTVAPRAALIPLAVLGVAASLVDSVLGALVQARYRCASCGRLEELPACCGRSDGRLVGGVRGLHNEHINLVMTALAALGYAGWIQLAASSP